MYVCILCVVLWFCVTCNDCHSLSLSLCLSGVHFLFTRFNSSSQRPPPTVSGMYTCFCQRNSHEFLIQSTLNN
uniref:Putative secreted protein n=1 Tax=Anopheles marajoara TaxID=58244 RepID=A0A2M4CES3_9DIPT